jgi:hypothetical protein
MQHIRMSGDPVASANSLPLVGRLVCRCLVGTIIRSYPNRWKPAKALDRFGK